MADSTTGTPTYDEDDYFAEAVINLTGYAIPSRSSLFKGLTSASSDDFSDLQLFRMEISGMSMRAVTADDYTALYRTQTSGGDDYVLAFYDAGGDGAHSSVHMKKARIIMIGVGVNDKGRATLWGDKQITGGGKFEGSYSHTQWDSGPMAQYISGSKLAIDRLVNNYSTEDFEFAGLSVTDANTVDLTSFVSAAQSFDRAMQFFKDHSDTVAGWMKSLGEDQAAWKGTAASLFWHLLKELKTNYDGYVSQLGGRDYSAGYIYGDYHPKSKISDALVKAMLAAHDAAVTVQKAWDDWATDGKHDPHYHLTQVLDSVSKFVIDNNINHVQSKTSTYSGYQGSSYTSTSYSTDAGFKQVSEYGDLTQKTTWQNISAAAVKSWADYADKKVGGPSKTALSTLKNAWIDVVDAIDKEIKNKNTETLEEVLAKEKQEIAEKEAKDNQDKLNNNLNNLNNNVNGLNDDFNDLNKDLNKNLDQLDDNFDNLNKDLNKNLDGLGDNFKDLNNDLNKNLDGLGDGLNKNLNDLNDGLNKNLNTVGDDFNDLNKNLNENLNDLGNGLNDGLNDLNNGLGDNMNTLSDDLNDAFSNDPNGDPNGVTDSNDPLNRMAFTSVNPNSLLGGDNTDKTNTKKLNSPTGATTQLNDDGTLTSDFPDGSTSSFDPDTGDLTTTDANGNTTTQHLNPGDTFTNPDGSVSTLNPDGTLTTDFPDGSQQTLDPSTGQVTTLNPDGSIASQDHLDPTDGSFTMPDGGSAQLNGDGSLSSDFADGSHSTFNPDTGTLTTTDPSGHTTTTHLDPGDTFTNPDGSTTTLNPDGTLTTKFPDGSTQQLNPDTGQLTTTDPSGHSTTTDLVPDSGSFTTPDGNSAQLNGDGTLHTEFADGSQQDINPDTGDVTVTDSNGHTTTTHLDPGESFTNPDGSTTTLNPDGTLTTKFPDGSVQQLNPDTGELTTTDPSGHSTTTDINGDGLKAPKFDTEGLNTNSSLNTDGLNTDGLGGNGDPLTLNGGSSPLNGGGLGGGSLNSSDGLDHGLDGDYDDYDSTPYDGGSLRNGSPSDGGVPLNAGFGTDQDAQSPAGAPMSPMGMGGMGGGMGGMGGGGGQGGNSERTRAVLTDPTGAGARRGRGGVPTGVDEDEDVVITRPTTSSAPYPVGGPGAAGQNGRSTESGDRAREAWLTEDEDVWGTDEGGAPAVLGR
jgi:hypothetical protein